jgi:hypothetical protein
LTTLLSNVAMNDAIEAMRSTIHLFEVILEPRLGARYID